MVPAASTAPEASAPPSARFTPAEVELERVDGGGLETPTTRPAWLRRTRAAFKNSVWAPVALKLAGLALGMIALSGIGVVSILSGASGVPIPLAGMLGADLRAPWLANPSTATAHAPASSALSAPPAASGAAPVSASAGNAPAAPPASSPSGERSAGERSAGAASAGMTQDGKVILNLATVEDLRHLPGVGQKRADAIVALRTRLGHFKQVNDLLRVKGIGVRGLKKLIPHVVLDAPKNAT